MIDYSKWDKLELSDDSDVEVHPNVDKRSFIRMKQRQIHDERVKRDNDIRTLRIQSEMYEHLNKRVDGLLMKLSDEDLFDEAKRNDFLKSNFDPNEKSKEQDIQDTPTYNEMIEDLFTQIFDDNKVENGAELRKLIVAHRKKIDDVSTQNRKKLDQLLEEKSHYITSEDIHTGFDSFYTNKEQIKKQSEAAAQAAKKQESSKAVEKVTEIETLNTPSVETVQTSQTEKEELDNLKCFPETENFGKIKMKNYTDSAKFLRTNPFILSTNQKDALLMKAFDAQLKGDSSAAENIVHQSLIIQYISDLTGKNASIGQKEKAIGIFFQRILQDNSLLLKETESTFNHIKQRCEILKKEHGGNLSSLEDEGAEQEEQIQLKSMDPNSELTVNIPDASKDKEKYQEFLKLPSKMQDAVKSGSLDEINQVFASMKLKDAEEVLEIFEKSGVIGIQAVLENEDEWENMKNNGSSAIELRSTDPSVDLVVIKPDESNAEQYAEFLKLPVKMQEAVKSESLERVNHVFATSPADQAQEMLQLLENSGVLALYRRKEPTLADEVD